MLNILRRLGHKMERPDPSLQNRIPAVNFDTFIQSPEYHLRMVEPSFSDGNISLLELLILNSLVHYHQPKSIFEIGTFNGRTTLNLAANSAPSARILTLDLPPEGLTNARFALDEMEKKYVEKETSGTCFANRPEARMITQLYGDSAQFDFGPYKNSMDFVFVDASHTYDYVRNDSNVALGLLRDGKGTIVWHDYGRPQWWPGVIKALNELFERGGDFSGMMHFAGTSLVYLHRD